jgi:osmotically-inducible protein OsmY
LVDASNIELQVKDGVLILSGTVDTRFEKRRAENLVENVSGVKNVQNNLRVKADKATVPHTFG